jgi:hypothetical protein
VADDVPVRRVVVRRSVAAARPGTHRYPFSREIDEQTELGDAYMRSLTRSQLRLGVTVCLVLVALLGGLPLLFALVPAVGRASVLGVRLPWLLLGVVPYPFMLAVGWFYVRQAEANERSFAEIVRDRAADPAGSRPIQRPGPGGTEPDRAC